MGILKEVGLTEAQARKILAGRKRKPKILPIHITDKVFEFGVVSDTHLGSTEEKLDELHTFYEICRKEGIKHVLHPGDLVAGTGLYRGQENEIHVFGFQRQGDYFVENFPKTEGIKTFFILGNHDLVYWVKNGADIGAYIAERRPDMVYLGHDEADVNFGGVRIRLYHPGGGTAYALSYRLQKYAEQIQPGKKPHIILQGHFHRSEYFFYRNIHCFDCGTFESQTTFQRRKAIQPALGGWTIKLHLGDRKSPVVAISPTFIPFFEKGDGR